MIKYFSSTNENKKVIKATKSFYKVVISKCTLYENKFLTTKNFFNAIENKNIISVTIISVKL